MIYNLIIGILLLIEIGLFILLAVINANTFGKIRILKLFFPYSEFKLYQINASEDYIKKVLRYNKHLYGFLITTSLIIVLIFIVYFLSDGV